MTFQTDYKKAYRIAWKILKNRDDVEDVLQTATLKMLQSKVNPDNVDFWYNKIVRNTALDMKRSISRRKEVSNTELPEVSIHNSDKLFYDEKNRLYKAWHKLRPNHKEILKLHILESLSHPEIAKRNNIKVGTSMSRTYYAIQAMKFMLQEN